MTVTKTHILSNFSLFSNCVILFDMFQRRHNSIYATMAKTNKHFVTHIKLYGNQYIQIVYDVQYK